MISKKQNSIIKEGSKTISSLLVQLNTLFKELVSVQSEWLVAYKLQNNLVYHIVE